MMKKQQNAELLDRLDACLDRISSDALLEELEGRYVEGPTLDSALAGSRLWWKSHQHYGQAQSIRAELRRCVEVNVKMHHAYDLAGLEDLDVANDSDVALAA